MVALPAGERGGRFTLAVSGTGLLPEGRRELIAEDLGPSATTIVYATKLIASGTDYALWRIDGTLRSLPRDTVQIRRLVLKLADASVSIPMTFKNTPAGDFAWAVSGLSALQKRLWTSEDTISFSVQVGPVPARNVRLVQPDFVATNGSVLQPGFKLCKHDAPACDGKPLVLDANHSHALELRPAAVSAAAGQYAGELRLVADEKPFGEMLPLALVVSSDMWRIVGVGLLILGTILAFLINPLLRGKIARAQALRPAAVLRQQAATLNSEMQDLEARAEATLPRAKKLIDWVVDQMNENALDHQGFIPPRVPLYYSSSAPAAAANTYQNLLTESAKRLNGVAYVLNEGVREVLACPGASPKDPLFQTAITELDGLLHIDVEPNTVLFADTRAIVEAFVSKPSKNRSVVNGRGGGRRDLSVRQLDFELNELNLTGWMAFSLISIMVGYVVLVALNPAFGSWQDLVLCALWGFGLPTAGQQLNVLTPGSVVTNLGVNLLR
ncbi:hypothetical protein [Sphingomonas sp. Leaf339]|uniref:hypothetical protein n=1 Tax=Sphingomonas sp. Leaf339 TaxID=1736343 RepID=UPI0012E3AF6E|nr:hypothetical protein [Sphingomonas sp. Leaf339]